MIVGIGYVLIFSYRYRPSWMQYMQSMMLRIRSSETIMYGHSGLSLLQTLQSSIQATAISLKVRRKNKRAS